MTSPKSPAFQFYPHDFLAGRVATYSLEEVGAYITLLNFDWTLDGLPMDEADDRTIGGVCPKLSRNSLQTFAKLCRTSARKFERVWAKIGVHFVVAEDGRLRNPRLQREREKQLAYSESMSANGKRGGRPKAAEKPQVSRGLAAAKPDESTPSPTPSKRKEYTTPHASWVDRLHAVWTEHVGEARIGYLGKELKASVDRHGVDRVERAMRAYIAVQHGAGKPCKPKWFAEQMQAWVDRTATPIAVIDGEMSPSLELLTRPKAS